MLQITIRMLRILALSGHSDCIYSDISDYILFKLIIIALIIINISMVKVKRVL
jgi:hypothetical protein